MKKNSIFKPVFVVFAIIFLFFSFSSTPDVPSSNDISESDTSIASISYTEPEYNESEYSEPEYTEPEYSEPEYTEPEYTEPEYTDDYVVYITKTGKCYHASYCGYLKSKIQTTVKQAKALGYRPCSRCNP